jgi:hypothetical protein
MRRATRFGLAGLAVVAVISGVYVGYWFVVAGQIEDGVTAWAQSERADKVEVSWQKLRVTGFPTAFRVELETVGLRDNALMPAPEFRIPAISGTARPWDFAKWRLAAMQGFTAGIASAGERAPVRLTAQKADGIVAIETEGGWTLWLNLQDISAQAVSKVRVNSANAWIIAPPKPPAGHTEPSIALAADARRVTLPAAVEPLGDTIDELDFGATVKGAILNGKLPEALSAWRDAGGTVELDNLRVKWGALGARASGTIALDPELQPMGAFSGAIEGYDQILTALVQGGRLRAADASLARIALTLLAKAGPDGEPEIKTAFTIQNGQMYLGPAKLGKAPRLTWE